jgi:hypothetical protein
MCPNQVAERGKGAEVFCLTSLSMAKIKWLATDERTVVWSSSGIILTEVSRSTVDYSEEHLSQGHFFPPQVR